MERKEEEMFVEAFCGNEDLVKRPLKTGEKAGAFFYIDGMADTERLEKEIVTPLIQAKEGIEPTKEGLFSVVGYGGTIEESDRENAVAAVAGGDVALCLSGRYFLFSLRKANTRAVSEPPTSSVVKGPREGFVEDLKTNVVLLRRKLRTSRLVFEKITLGTLSSTAVLIAYVRGVTPMGTVEQVKRKLGGILIDGVLDSSYVAQMLSERPYSLVKQVGSSEKADVIASKLLDGRVAILVDGSPIALTVPFLLIEDFEDSQDRYKMASLVNFSRFVRALGVFFAVVLPGAFVAVQSHQYQILPLQLMITILNATEGIPFSPTLEMIVALLLFEILTEAGVRMPKHVGLALSVVGAIVLGQTAVEAGFLSSLTVLIVAMSGIGIYTVPDQVGVISCMRMLLVVVAGLLGVYGLVMASLMILAYLSELSFFGSPYLAPFAPVEGEDLKDALWKESLLDATKRPFAGDLRNKTRLRRGNGL